MGLWIRSQDRNRLKEISSISILELYQHKETKEYYNAIFSDNEKFTKVYKVCGMGIYSTDGKAIKVLDMIQERIEIQNVLFGEMNGNSDLGGTICTQRIKVFQMPQEDEVAE